MSSLNISTIFQIFHFIIGKVSITNNTLKMATEVCDLEVIIEAFNAEKAQLEDKLDSGLEDSEREQLEARLGEICADTQNRNARTRSFW